MAPAERSYLICHYELRGVRVKNLDPGSWLNLPDSSSPDGFRGMWIPTGRLGTLTGEVCAFLDKWERGRDAPFPIFESVGEEAYRAFVANANRVKSLLERAVVFAPLRSRLALVEKAYWDEIEGFTGEELMACYTQLGVVWDGIFNLGANRASAASYVPLLELSDAPPYSPTFRDKISYRLRRILRR
jgi:hypothetical protein